MSERRPLISMSWLTTGGCAGARSPDPAEASIPVRLCLGHLHDPEEGLALELGGPPAGRIPWATEAHRAYYLGAARRIGPWAEEIAEHVRTTPFLRGHEPAGRRGTHLHIDTRLITSGGVVCSAFDDPDAPGGTAQFATRQCAAYDSQCEGTIVDELALELPPAGRVPWVTARDRERQLEQVRRDRWIDDGLRARLLAHVGTTPFYAGERGHAGG